MRLNTNSDLRDTGNALQALQMKELRLLSLSKDGVSSVQEKQMVTQKGDNTYVIELWKL